MDKARQLMYFTTGGFNPGTWYWESVSLLRKLLLFGGQHVVENVRLRLMLGIWVLVASVWANMRWQPWVYREVSHLEMGSLLLVAVAYGAALLLILGDATFEAPAASAAFAAFLFALVGSAMMFLVAIVWAAGYRRKVHWRDLVAQMVTARLRSKIQHTKRRNLMQRWLWDALLVNQCLAEDALVSQQAAGSFSASHVSLNRSRGFRPPTARGAGCTVFKTPKSLAMLDGTDRLGCLASSLSLRFEHGDSRRSLDYAKRADACVAAYCNDDDGCEDDDLNAGTVWAADALADEGYNEEAAKATACVFSASLPTPSRTPQPHVVDATDDDVFSAESNGLFPYFPPVEGLASASSCVVSPTLLGVIDNDFDVQLRSSPSSHQRSTKDASKMWTPLQASAPLLDERPSVCARRLTRAPSPSVDDGGRRPLPRVASQWPGVQVLPPIEPQLERTPVSNNTAQGAPRDPSAHLPNRGGRYAATIRSSSSGSSSEVLATSTSSSQRNRVGGCWEPSKAVVVVDTMQVDCPHRPIEAGPRTRRLPQHRYGEHQLPEPPLDVIDLIAGVSRSSWHSPTNMVRGPNSMMMSTSSMRHQYAYPESGCSKPLFTDDLLDVQYEKSYTVSCNFSAVMESSRYFGSATFHSSSPTLATALQRQQAMVKEFLLLRHLYQLYLLLTFCDGDSQAHDDAQIWGCYYTLELECLFALLVLLRQRNLLLSKKRAKSASKDNNCWST